VEHPQAQAKARELQRLIDEGTDPRSLKRDALATAKADEQRQQEAAKIATIQALTVGEAWGEYVKERTPHWGELHIKDHARLARAGGVESTRGTRGRGVTVAGPLHPLLGLALVDLTPQTIEAWAAQQGKTRPTTARLAWRLLRAFLTWCSEHPAYGQLVGDKNPAKTRKTRESLGKAGVKTDALLKEQLPVWFQHVRLIGNPCIAAYLQTLLLTGARPGEVLALKWEDMNTRWHGLTIRDKVEGERVIPLTPYVHGLIAALPRRNEWVFSSFTTIDPMSKPHSQHSQACAAAGIDGLTLHGLRRSFKSLTEWLEIPAGVVAQIMGHKPSATAEKHYTVRPLDLLRLHHEKIEAWVLEQAGVKFTPAAEPGKLALVG
jgi:integrase